MLGQLPIRRLTLAVLNSTNDIQAQTGHFNKVRAWLTGAAASSRRPSQRTDCAARAAAAADAAALAAADVALEQLSEGSPTPPAEDPPGSACMGAVDARSSSAPRPFIGWNRNPLLAPAARTERRVRPPCAWHIQGLLGLLHTQTPLGWCV